MTTDSRRLMRPGVVATMGTTQSGCLSVLPSCPLLGQRVATSPKERPYEGLSRMKGNFHVRFFGGVWAGNRPHLPAVSRSIFS
jgi:hypothetical protein